MVRLSFSGILPVLAGLLCLVGPARANIQPAPLSIPERVLRADAVVVGKVVELEQELVKANPHARASEKVNYRIAVIRIDEGLRGAKGVTTVRVGFQAPTTNQPPQDLPPLPKGIAISRPPSPVLPSLTKDQEGCFFLMKHHDADFYVLMPNGRHLDRKEASFDRQLALVKQVIKVLDNQARELNSKEAADRRFAAFILLQKHRTYPQVSDLKTKVVQEPIDADESKAIMRNLAETDWTANEANDPATGKAPKFGAMDGISLRVLFRLLNLSPKDGWEAPKQQPNQDFRDFTKIWNDAVVKWLKDNADTYRIQRFVLSSK